MTLRLAYFVSHPIQYQAPLLRQIVALPEVDLRVVFERLPPSGGAFDPGFGRKVDWDLPLTDGYDNVVLSETRLDREIAAADVVWMHGWQSRTLRRAVRHAHALRKPVLMRGENCDLAMPDGTGPRGLAKRMYLRHLFGRCTAFLTIGSHNAAYYRQRGVPQSRLFAMPYAIDNRSFAEKAAAARPHRAACRRRLGVPEGCRVVLFVGKLQRRKHPEMVAEVARRASRTDRKVVAVLVGDGEMASHLRDGYPEALVLGFRNQGDLPALYDSADLLIVPSEREPWGLVVNEAMACGTPVVASDQVGSAADLLDDRCGGVFPAGDAARLLAHAERCLADAERLGRAAAERIGRWGFDEDIAGLREALRFVSAAEA